MGSGVAETIALLAAVPLARQAYLPSPSANPQAAARVRRSSRTERRPQFAALSDCRKG